MTLVESIGHRIENDCGVFWLHPGSPIGSQSIMFWLSQEQGIPSEHIVLRMHFAFVILESLIMQAEPKQGNKLYQYFQMRNGNREHNWNLYQSLFEIEDSEYVILNEMYESSRRDTTTPPQTPTEKAKKNDESAN
jgi:hypothetical protein